MTKFSLPQLSAEFRVCEAALPEPEFDQDSRLFPASEIELTRDCIFSIRNSLDALVCDPCAFRHHFVWKNEGKPLPLCSPEQRDHNLLCAHSSGPGQVMSRAIAFLVENEFIPEDLGNICHELASGDQLYALDGFISYVAAESWRIANSSKPRTSNHEWMIDRMREMHSSLTPETLSSENISSEAASRQDQIAGPRIVLYQALLSTFEKLSGQDQVDAALQQSINRFIEEVVLFTLEANGASA